MRSIPRVVRYHTAFVIGPAVLTVIIAYLVFFMDPSRSDRAALSVVCFLVQSGLMSTQLISLPQLGLQSAASTIPQRKENAGPGA